MVDSYRYDLPEGLVPAGWYPANPSVVDRGDYILMNLRLVNYEFRGETFAQSVVGVDGPGRKSRNVLCRCDHKGHITAWSPIRDLCAQARQGSDIPFAGLEDLRIFMWGDELCFTCAMYNRGGEIIQMWGSLGRESEIPWQQPVYMVWLRRLERPPMASSVEKNWIPRVVDGKLWMIYDLSREIWLGYSPRAELINVEWRGEYTMRRSVPKDEDAIREVNTWHGLVIDIPSKRIRETAYGELRGSTLLVPFGDDQHVALVHSTAKIGEVTHYRHHFALFDFRDTLVAISRPFTFGRAPVEYAMAMWRVKRSTWKVIFSVRDNTLYKTEFSRAHIMELLEIN